MSGPGEDTGQFFAACQSHGMRCASSLPAHGMSRCLYGCIRWPPSQRWEPSLWINCHLFVHGATGMRWIVQSIANMFIVGKCLNKHNNVNCTHLYVVFASPNRFLRHDDLFTSLGIVLSAIALYCTSLITDGGSTCAPLPCLLKKEKRSPTRDQKRKIEKSLTRMPPIPYWGTVPSYGKSFPFSPGACSETCPATGWGPCRRLSSCFQGQRHRSLMKGKQANNHMLFKEAIFCG